MNQTKTLTATYTGKNLSEYCNAINNGTTSDVRFYVNGNTVTVGYMYEAVMPEAEQVSNLKWFCGSSLASIN